jgi:N-acetylglucosaminyl-diphospho-decaprenol L-rhamnosyltransferase
MKLGIAVVDYRSAADTEGLIRSIVDRRADETVAIAIVDNGDEPADLEPAVAFARANGVECHVVGGHGNVGYAAGNNLAAAHLIRNGATVIWVLNPDTRVVDGHLKALAGVVGVAATSVRRSKAGPTRPGTGAISLWTGRSGPGGGLTYVAGHSLVVDATTWQRLGGLSERFFLFFEEADLAVRCRALGIAASSVPEIVVTHAGGSATGATTDLRDKSATAYFHASRSCVIFFRRHRPWRLPVVVAARLGYAAKVLRVAGIGGATAVMRGVFAGLTA